MIAQVNEVQLERLGDSLRRLHELLPLKERQQSLEKQHIEVHRAILQSLVERGQPLTVEEIAGMLGSNKAARYAVALLGSYDLIIRDELAVKNENNGDLVVLDAMGGRPVGAYPMTTEETPHKIVVNGNDLYAMCAVDALAVGVIFNTEVEINSKCYVTGEPVHIRQKGNEILNAQPSDEIRVGIRWQRPTQCAAHVLCRQMVFLKDPGVAQQWCIDPPTMDLFTLNEAVAFGEAFFLPLLRD
jgi:hypothetical protein